MGLLFLLITSLGFFASCNHTNNLGQEPAGMVNPASNANLASVMLSEGVLSPVFSAGQLNYTTTVNGTVSGITLVAETESVAAELRLNGELLTSGATSSLIPLVVGINVITLEVTSSDETRTRAYMITVTRPAATNIADLAGLSHSQGVLTPIFQESRLNYLSNASFTSMTTQVTATLKDAAASLTINGLATASGMPSADIDLAEGDNVITIEVTSKDGTNLKEYVIVITRGSASSFAQTAYIKASNADAFDRFGDLYGVAISGNLMAVGSVFERSLATGIDGDETDNGGGLAPRAGAVYVFLRDAAGNWVQEAYLKPSTNNGRSAFGYSVALSGNTLVVGAPAENGDDSGINVDETDSLPGAILNIGAAYIFSRSAAGVWTQDAYVKASNVDRSDQFGIAVAIDGDLVAVGARAEASAAMGIDGDQDDNSSKLSGAVYVYGRDLAGVWSQQAYIKASNAGVNDVFGTALAISGGTLAVGASGEASSATGLDGDQTNNSALFAGAVYIFTTDFNGNWSQQAYLKASNTSASDGFGITLDVDGDTLAVGALGESSAAQGIDGDQFNDDAVGSGAVYMFERNAMGVWSQTAYLKASGSLLRYEFGVSMALQGNMLAVGARAERSAATGIDGDETSQFNPSSGAVYTFMRDSGGNWSQQHYVKASNTNTSDFFGSAVAYDGGTLAVGAPKEDSSARGVDGDPINNDALDSGAVYLFE